MDESFNVNNLTFFESISWIVYNFVLVTLFFTAISYNENEFAVVYSFNIINHFDPNSTSCISYPSQLFS